MIKTESEGTNIMNGKNDAKSDLFCIQTESVISRVICIKLDNCYVVCAIADTLS